MPCGFLLKPHRNSGWHWDVWCPQGNAVAVQSPQPRSHPCGWGQTVLEMLLVVSNTLLGQDLCRYCEFSTALQITENGIAWVCVAQSSFVYSFREQKKFPPSAKQKQKHACILSISSTKIRHCLTCSHPRPHTPQCTWLWSENSLCAQPLFTAPAIPRRDPTDKGSLFLFPDKGSFILPRGLAVISGELCSRALGCFHPVLGEGLNKREY